MKVNVVYRAEVIDADVADSMSTAAARMRENDVSSLAVLQDGELIGILSERDVVQAVADGVSLSHALVRQYMTDHPATANLEEDSSTVAKRMIDLGVRHLPVVDSHGLVGVVSARDLLNLEAWNS